MVGREPHRPLVGADPRHRRGQPVTALSSVDHRAVAGAAAGGQLHPGHALLGGLDQVEPPAADRRAEAADLADRLGAVRSSCSRCSSTSTWAPCVPAGLLVGGEAEHDRPLGHARRRGCAPAPPRAASRRSPSCRPRRGPRGSRPGSRRRTGRPASPRRPPGRRRGGRAAAARPRRPGVPPHCATTRRPARLELEELGLDADLVEQRGDVLGRLPLPRPGLVAVVGGVDPDQVAAQLDDLAGGVVGQGWYDGCSESCVTCPHPDTRGRVPTPDVRNRAARLLEFPPHSSGWRNWQTR